MADYEKKIKKEAEKLLSLVDDLKPGSKAEAKWFRLAEFVIIEHRLYKIINNQ